MPAPLSTPHRNRLQAITSDARDEATSICRTALENLAVHEGDYRPHMSVDQRLLRNRLRARGKALGDTRDERSGRQALKRLAEEAAYEHWHRLLFTRFLAENHLLITDAANGSVPVTLEDCEELASELGAKDGFELACRFSSTTLPGVFRTDDPILELAFPANDRKKLRDLLDSIPQDVFTASDSLGWTYQFWQTKRKKEVNDSGVKIGADELSPVTQLFTEDYMVDFLLDNTLGAWHAGKILAANSRLAESAQSEEELRQAVALPGCPGKYLRFIQGEDGKWTPAAGTFGGWPKSVAELKCLDPCMGSGHFVVAMFERLVALRMAEEKLDEVAAVVAVLRDNLYGLELDPRCTQIAAFNLALAAWRRVGHCPLPPLHLACSGMAPNAKREDWLKLTADAPELRFQMGALYDLFQKAPVLGSLINPRADKAVSYGDAFSKLQPLLDEALKSEQNRLRDSVDTSDYEMTVTAQGVAKAAEILAGQFTLVATNVPFLGMNRQSEFLFEFLKAHYPSAKADLATAFIQRCLECCSPGATTAIVSPQIWLFLGSYKTFRSNLLEDMTWNFVARLGPGAFGSIGGEVVNVGLFVLSKTDPSAAHTLAGFDVSGSSTPDGKAALLEDLPALTVAQVEQLLNPDARVTLESTSNLPLLSKYTDSYWGIGSGDIPRFASQFWEIPELNPSWKPLHVTSANKSEFTGREQIIDWRKSSLELCITDHERELWLANRWNRGSEGWDKKGVAISQMGGLGATLFSGDVYQNGVAAIIPRDERHLPAVWAFCSSDDFCAEVRKIDKKLSVTNLTLIKVPFDLAHWQKVAADNYPHGLPKPFSSDPTQWLFKGHPAGSDQPLHVAVARLLGYQWPRQTGSSFPDCPALGPDGLEPLADTDGIVCLPPLNREQPAATRLRALLTAALGSYNERDLIQKSGLKGKGSSKTSLEDWLRDDFFSQHCALFHSRPFLWHLWDGEKDGFHALVNYHKLDHANLKKLAYTYLGDWIRDQDAAAKAETPGAAERLGAAKKLQAKLIAILEGEAPLDLFIRWKPLHQQPLGWNPDLNDGVRLNIRPFLLAGDVGAKGAGLFRAKPGIDPKPEKPDRGTEPQRPKADYPWFWCAEDPGKDAEGGKDFTGRRWNTAHFTLERKQRARDANA
jgi:hypothetical protein